MCQLGLNLIPYLHSQGDFVLLPCDLLLAPTSTCTLSLSSLLATHLCQDNLVTSLFYHRTASAVPPESKNGPPTLLTVYDAASSTLLDLHDMDDIAESDEIALRTSLLQRYPRGPTLTTRLLPAQLYVMSREILGLLTDPKWQRRLEGMETVREFVGWVARLDWRHGGRDRVGYRDPGTVQREDGLGMGRSTTQLAASRPPASTGPSKPTLDRSVSYATSSGHATGANTPSLVSRSSFFRAAGTGIEGAPRRDQSTADWSDAAGASLTSKSRMSREGAGSVQIVIWRDSDGWCGRGNTVQGWIDNNRAVSLPLWSPLMGQS